MDPSPRNASLEIIPFSERQQRVLDTLSELYANLSDQNLDLAMFEVNLRSDYLKSKYPDFLKYAMYHVLGFGSISKSMGVIHDDFPGEDSVELFVNNLVKKYTK